MIPVTSPHPEGAGTHSRNPWIEHEPVGEAEVVAVAEGRNGELWAIGLDRSSKHSTLARCRNGQWTQPCEVEGTLRHVHVGYDGSVVAVGAGLSVHSDGNDWIARRHPEDMQRVCVSMDRLWF